MGLKAFLHDLHTIRRLILISALLFCASIIVGWLSSGTIQSILAQQMEGLGEVAQRLQNSEHPQWSFLYLSFSIMQLNVCWLYLWGLYLESYRLYF